MKKIVLSTILLTALGFSQTFTVSNVSEFRQALEDSALNGEDDTIQLKAGVYKTTSDGLGSFTYNDEEPHSLTLTATPNTNVILDGDNTNRVFFYHNGYSPKFILKNISIQNGNASESLEYASGIITNAKEVEINNCIFKNNIANWKGGALYLSNSKFTIIKNSSFVNNKSQLHWGGGIYSESDKSILLVMNSIFSKNTASTGGAIHSMDNLYIIHSTLDTNGESAVSSISAKISNSIFNNNISEIGNFQGNVKIYNSYLNYAKIGKNDVIKKNCLTPSVDGEINYLDNDLHLSSNSPVLNKGMDIFDIEFKKFILDKSEEDILKGRLSDSDKKILEVLTQLEYDKAYKKRDITPDLGAYKYDSTLKPIDDNPSDEPNSNPNDNPSDEPTTGGGGGGGSTDYLFPLFALFLILYRNREKYFSYVK